MKRELLYYCSIAVLTLICFVFFVKYRMINRENEFLSRYNMALSTNYKTVEDQLNSDNILLLKGSKEKINFDTSINDLLFAKHKFKDVILDTTLILFFSSKHCSSCIIDELTLLDEKMRKYSSSVKVFAHQSSQKVFEQVYRTNNLEFQFFFYNSEDFNSSLVKLMNPAYFIVTSGRELRMPYLSRKESHVYTEQYFDVIKEYLED